MRVLRGRQYDHSRLKGFLLADKRAIGVVGERPDEAIEDEWKLPEHGPRRCQVPRYLRAQRCQCEAAADARAFKMVLGNLRRGRIEYVGGFKSQIAGDCAWVVDAERDEPKGELFGY